MPSPHRTPEHIRLFNQILDELGAYHGAELHRLAEDAGVSITTLYKWQGDPPMSPQLRTFFNVATAMGYELRLVKVRGKHHIRRAA